MPINFMGGPLAGQGTMTDEEMAGMGGGPGAMAPPGAPPGPPEAAEGEEPDEAALFSGLLDSIRQLLGLGTLTEQNKLHLEKASTLVQQIKASEEKDQQSAMSGALNPSVAKKLGGGPGGGY